jgi:hypothetical protein
MNKLNKLNVKIKNEENNKQIQLLKLNAETKRIKFKI